MRTSAALRLWHTLRYLRPVQFYGRAWFRLARPRPDLHPPPPLRAVQGRWISCARTSSMTGPNTLRFLGADRRIAEASDWNRTDWPRLWLYNAHYFDDLVAVDAAARGPWHRALITRWIADNPAGVGVGWEPYPTSLRIVNWIKWALAEHALDDAARLSLAVQARWLRRRLEVHLLGNHLWANAKALLFAGAFFSDSEADAWRQKGLKLLRRELEQQILADGGHFERSPMYHSIVLEDLLDLVQWARVVPSLFDRCDVQAWTATATRMLRWLAVMTHPDGDIALFNDAAFGIAPQLANLCDYALAVQVPLPALDFAPIEALADSGYMRLQVGPALVIADVGAIGPDYLPGHAHADTLGFELSLHGQRAIVDAGTSRYDASLERLWQRGTAAHNTVEIDDENSSEVWNSFRVARRARPFDVRHEAHGDEVRLSAAHNGYRRLPGRNVHRREWRLQPCGLRVIDRVEGRFGTAVARFRLHPDLQRRLNEDAGHAAAGYEGVVEAAWLRLTWRCTGASQARLAQSTWHPAFGVTLDCQVLELVFVGDRLETEFHWE